MHHHLAKALEAIWTLTLGGFLGVSAGLVIAIIVIFKGAEEVAASPGIAPYGDPMFAAFHHQAVAGYTGQMLFAVGGVVALILLVLAVLALSLGAILLRGRACVGSKGAGVARAIALAGALLFMGLATGVTIKMNAQWPGLYDTSAAQAELTERRAEFDQLHKRSSRVVTIAWVCGLIALGVSPWCRAPRPLESPSNS